MSLTLPERRRIAVVSGDQRVDLAVPLDETLGDVLSTLGMTLEAGRHVVLERSGAETRLGTRGIDLVDGAMYSVIDLRTQLAADPGTRATATVRDSGALWWMLAAVAVVAIGVQSLQPPSGGQDATTQRLVVTAALGVAAIVSALVWARRHPADAMSGAVSMLSPVVLAFAAGFVMIPMSLAAGPHLAVLCGLLLATVLSALLTATVGGRRLRSSAGVATVILFALSAVWGVALLTGMSMAAAAAISAGAVPLALRALPTTLVNVDDGHHIDFERFMSARWTVRGSVPATKTEVAASTIRDVVDESSARLLAGTALLSVVPVIMIPLALTADLTGDVLVLAGTIAVTATVVIGLLLISRHTASAALRWVPRAAAIAVLTASIAAATAAFGPLVLTVAAAGFLGAGLLAAAVLVPIGRGARSLAWSRLADVVEALAVALSLPAAFLAADVLGLLRGMMAA
jgi:hypothetical protein